MQIVKINKQGNALRVTIPASYARQLALTKRDHVQVWIELPELLCITKVPRIVQARSARGEK